MCDPMCLKIGSLTSVKINLEYLPAFECHPESSTEVFEFSAFLQMLLPAFGLLTFLLLLPVTIGAAELHQNSTYHNPILPGFHPDPSCIFVREWDNTFFCASSSFNAFPGIPIHASKDLQNWKLIGHVLNRKEQLPGLAETNRSTSGIWAPALRYHQKNFYLVTTLVNDDLPADDALRWDNIIFKASDPYKPSSWSVAKHFKFEGYDTSPFWDADGTSYITGSHAWKVQPGIHQTTANLDTGEIGEWTNIWNGTGGQAPEGPHIYLNDGYYYLMVAEGGTGLGHFETMARSKAIGGPFEVNPANPILTNANTTNYFQTVGHADLFQDASGNWWSVALSTRGGPSFLNYPMGRETVLAPVTWKTGEWPYITQINGEMSGWPMPPSEKDIPGSGPFINEGDDIDFAPGSKLPAHFTYWRFPNPDAFTVSPPGHPHTLKIKPSKLNLTALNGNYAGPEGQNFVGRRQQDTLFTYKVDVDFSPKSLEEEAGLSVFLTQNHHLDLGIVMLPRNSSAATLEDNTSNFAKPPTTGLTPHFRFRGISYIAVPDPVIVPIPEAWAHHAITLQIAAHNSTHYVFSAGPAGSKSELKEIITVSNEAVSWGFTGTILGVYSTTNGGSGSTDAYFSNWKYRPQGQLRK
ncbi:arabinofuranosidase [Crepidotus variabilis]|uniref:Arabinofuranosidase n=1 Tax=Crepidotus variabilis TaxID=179855 RepID=A0A9P6EI00_9AGAR|nr:arabinofuranosidase [Crepidotus variabilis]